MRIWSYRDRYDPERASFKTFAYQHGRGAMLDYCRRTYRHQGQESLIEEITSFDSQCDDSLDLLDENERTHILNEIPISRKMKREIKRKLGLIKTNTYEPSDVMDADLTPSQRQVAHMFYVQGKTIPEIQELLGHDPRPSLYRANVRIKIFKASQR